MKMLTFVLVHGSCQGGWCWTPILCRTVILVGHYLDAYIPQDNKSAFDLEAGLETIYKERALSGQGKEWLVASYEPEKFGVTNSIDIKWMSTRLSPMPWHTHDQPIRIINRLAKTLPKSYICCSAFGDS